VFRRLERTRPDRRARRFQPRLTLAVMAVVWGIATLAATFIIDAHIALRMPYIGDLAADYSRKTTSMVVAIGSSRTGDGVEINRLTAFLKQSLPGRRLSAFRAVVTGSGLVTQEAVLKALLSAGPKPSAVLLEVNPEFLHARKKWVNVNRDVTWWNLLDVGREALKRTGTELLESRLLPIYAKRFEVRRVVWRWAFECFGRVPPQLDELEPIVPTLWTGYIPNVPTRQPLSEEARAVQKRRAPPPLHQFEPTGSAARALERMLVLCDERSIPVLLVNAPICSESRKALAPVQSRFDSYIDELLRRFPAARYFDAAAEIPDEGFRDHHHANEYGQDLFCRRLAHVVLPETYASWENRTTTHRVVRMAAKAGGEGRGESETRR
jgi:hypothetical protein